MSKSKLLNNGYVAIENEELEIENECLEDFKTDIKDILINDIFNLKDEFGEVNKSDYEQSNYPLSDLFKILPIKDFVNYMIHRGHVYLSFYKKN